MNKNYFLMGFLIFGMSNVGLWRPRCDEDEGLPDLSPEDLKPEYQSILAQINLIYRDLAKAYCMADKERSLAMAISYRASILVTKILALRNTRRRGIVVVPLGRLINLFTCAQSSVEMVDRVPANSVRLVKLLEIARNQYRGIVDDALSDQGGSPLETHGEPNLEDGAPIAEDERSIEHSPDLVGLDNPVPEPWEPASPEIIGQWRNELCVVLDIIDDLYKVLGERQTSARDLYSTVLQTEGRINNLVPRLERLANYTEFSKNDDFQMIVAKVKNQSLLSDVCRFSCEHVEALRTASLEFAVLAHKANEIRTHISLQFDFVPMEDPGLATALEASMEAVDRAVEPTAEDIARARAVVQAGQQHFDEVVEGVSAEAAIDGLRAATCSVCQCLLLDRWVKGYGSKYPNATPFKLDKRFEYRDQRPEYKIPERTLSDGSDNPDALTLPFCCSEDSGGLSHTMHIHCAEDFIARSDEAKAVCPLCKSEQWGSKPVDDSIEPDPVDEGHAWDDFGENESEPNDKITSLD